MGRKDLATAAGFSRPEADFNQIYLEMLKQRFPEWDYSAPASAEAIADAEIELGVRFPDELRALYLEANGVRESEGNAAYLLPLSDLVSTTKAEWAEWEGFRPEFDLKPFIFFGLSTGDEAWGIDWKQPGRVIAFHHHMEGAYEVVGTNIAAVYLSDFTQFKDKFASS